MELRIEAHNGELVVTDGWVPDWEYPRERKVMYRTGARSAHYADTIIGRTVDLRGERCYLAGTTHEVAMDASTAPVTLYRPVRGRAGQVWRNGQWERDYGQTGWRKGDPLPES
jgi:hypothetical protein